MDYNACEFLPEHKNPLIDDIHNTLFGIVTDFFKSPDKKNQEQIAIKLVVILDTQKKISQSSAPGTAKINPNDPVARALISVTMCTSNGSHFGFPFLKEICNHLPEDSYDSFMLSVQNQIYLYVHSEKVKSMLQQMALGKSIEYNQNFPSSVTTENIDSLPVCIPELFHFILNLILYMDDKRQLSGNKFIPPTQCCLDLIYLSTIIFQLQLDSKYEQTNLDLDAFKNMKVNGDDGKSDLAMKRAMIQKNRGINEWFELFCLVCESLTKLMPVLHLTVLSGNECILNGSWSPNISLNRRQEILNSRINEAAMFSIPTLTAAFDFCLTRLRELLVQPNLLLKWHARSAALDTLLTVASQPYLPIPATQEVAESDTLQEEDLCDEYAADFEKFLATLN